MFNFTKMTITTYIVYKKDHSDKDSENTMSVVALPIAADHLQNVITTSFGEEDQDRVHYAEESLFQNLFPYNYKLLFDKKKITFLRSFLYKQDWLRQLWVNRQSPNVIEHFDFELYDDYDMGAFKIHFHVNIADSTRARIFYELTRYLVNVGEVLYEGDPFNFNEQGDKIFGEEAMNYHLFYKNFCGN